MIFINETGNSIKLNDIGVDIPFLGKQPQEIDADNVKRSKMFQTLCLMKKFTVISVSDEVIEKNLLRYQTDDIFKQSSKIEVLIRGHFYSNSGYGKANRNLVYSMARAGIKVAIDTADESSKSLSQIEIEKIARFKRDINFSIVIDSMIPTFSKDIDKSKYSILNTTVEACSVPGQFIDVCDKYDEIWVPSYFCKDVLSSYGINKKIFVIPNSVDTNLYNDRVKPHIFEPKLKNFIFITVLSWNYRKGFDVLLKSYLDEFSANDDVTLLIVSQYENRVDDKADSYIKDICKKYGDSHANIARLGNAIPEFEMPRIYKASSCFVLPSRGEGFGLPFVEAGMCGLPIISTNHSGQTMFLNQNNSYLVDIDKISQVENGVTGIHYWDGELFPKLSDPKVLKKLSSLMRHVYKNKSESLLKVEKLKNSLSSYSIENVGKQIQVRMQSIWKERYE